MRENAVRSLPRSIGCSPARASRVLTIASFLDGLETRSYPFIVAALDAAQLRPDRHSLAVDGDRHPDGAAGGAVLPRPHLAVAAGIIGRCSMSRGKLQDFLARMHPRLERIEARSIRAIRGG